MIRSNFAFKDKIYIRVAQDSVAYLDKHLTLVPVMVNVVSSIPSTGRKLFAKILNLLM